MKKNEDVKFENAKCFNEELSCTMNQRVYQIIVDLKKLKGT